MAVDHGKSPVTAADLMGVLLIDKPQGPTSHDIVQKIRKLTGIKKVGHAGTLDPFATGLLPVLVGKATRLSNYLTGSEKIYFCVVDLRYGTDTHDMEGKRISSHFTSFPSKEEVAACLERLTGNRLQVPPMFSAKKIRGEKCYHLARQGREIPRDPVKIQIFSISLLAYEKPYLTLVIRCSSGTYIRSLAHEIGERLGIGAHLSSLRRTASGGFHLKEAVSLKSLERPPKDRTLSDYLIPPEKILTDYPWLMIGEEGEHKFKHGRALSQNDILGAGEDEKPDAGRPYRVLNQKNLFLGLAQREKAAQPDLKEVFIYQPVVVLRTDS